nr:hypothetical protein [Tanacetum cinerariifolium]
MAFVSFSSNNSNSSNDVNTAQGVKTANRVNTASSQVNDASSLNIDNLSDVVIYAFLASQLNSTHLVNEDMEQIHHDDLEKMDLKWQMAMLTMRAKRFLKNTERKLNLNGNDSVAFDKTKVECYNYHKRGHFARESYKEGLKSIEQRLEFFKTNKSKYIEQINVLKIDIHCRDKAVTELQRKLDLAETKKEGIQNKLENASKSLNKIIECQIVDNYKKGLEYNAVPPPHTGLFLHPKSDLSYTGLEELFNEPKTEKSKDKSNDVEPESVRKDNDALIIKDWVLDDKEEKVEKKEVKPSINRINSVKATTDNNPRETVKNGEQPKQNTHRKRVNTAKPKATVNATKAKAKHKAVKGKKGNDVKASTCWAKPVVAQSNDFLSTKASNDERKKKDPDRDYTLLPLWTADSPFSTTSKSSQDNEFQPLNDGAKKVDEDLRKENECNDQGEEDSTNNTNRVNTVTLNINAANSSGVNVVGTNISIHLPPDPNMPPLEDIGIFEDSLDDEDVFVAEADFHNLDLTFQVSPIPTTRIHKDYPLDQCIRDLHSAP